MESSEGTEILIGSGLENGTYSVEIGGFSGEELSGDWKIWIEDTYGDGGHQATNISVTFNKQIELPDWLSVSPVSGTIEPSGYESITVTLDASLLEIGDYFGNIYIASNDPDEPEIDIPVKLTVDEASLITDNIDDDNYSVYPNPFSEFTRVQIPENIKNAEVTVYNSQGIFVKTLNVNGSLNYIWDGLYANGTKAEKGIYFINIKGDDSIKIFKILRF